MIKVRSKTLFIPAEEQSIGAVGEADSTVREFHIDRVSGDGVDLANLLFKLNIRYAGVRDIDRSDLEKVVTDNAIILRWLISSVTMGHAGTAFIQLDAFDNTGSCRWKSYPGAVYIEKSLGNAEIPSNTLSELEQLEKKFDKVGEGESARVEAEKKRVTAEEKREEAEGKRNTSLANIIAEEEKIKAVSAEAKGYKDSVSADKQEITTMKNEAVSAKNTAQQHANAAEASKNSTITEGTKIKEEVTALKNEANAAKADAVNAKNEAVSAKSGANAIKGEVLALKNEANTIKGEVQALKNETESRLQSAESNIQNQVMNATSYANMAERSSQQAEGYKMEAGVSAEKAKESETKTLEALKKAEASGGAGGVTTEELHSYVDTAVGKVKSGITEAEAVTIVGSELKKKEMPQTNYKGLAKETVSGGTGGLNSFGKTTLVDGETLSNVINGIAEGVKERTSKISWLESNNQNLMSKVDGSYQRASEIVNAIKMALSNNSYGMFKVGDYIDIPTTIYGTKKMRFYVAGIDIAMRQSIDFISFDYPKKIMLEESEITSLGNMPKVPETIKKLVNDRVMNDSELKELVGLKTLLTKNQIGNFDSVYFWTPEASEMFTTQALTANFIKFLMLTLRVSSSGASDDIAPNRIAYPLFNNDWGLKLANSLTILTSSFGTSGNVGLIRKGDSLVDFTSYKEVFKKIPSEAIESEIEFQLRNKPSVPICFRISAQ